MLEFTRIIIYSHGCIQHDIFSHMLENTSAHKTVWQMKFRFIWLST